jgi:endonuclease YncB( thermonuclease family)
VIEAFTDGAAWDVLAVPRYKSGKRYGDGDTVRLVRTGVFWLGDKRWRLTDTDPLGEPIRLVWVDTPEKADKKGNAQATADTSGWIERKLALGPLKVVCYDSGGWDRMLGDVISADGESLSAWLLTPREDGGGGWPLYVEGQ